MDYTTRQVFAGATADETEALVKALIAAFAQDRFALTTVGGQLNSVGHIEADEDLLAQFHRSVIVAGLLAGEVYVAESESKVIGVAIWFGPSRELFDSEDQHDAGLVPLFGKFSPELTAWWTDDFLPKYKTFTDTHFGEGTKTQAWHLQMLGTIPGHRRKGIATALINIIRKKRGTSKMCLETENPENLSFYEGNGFEVKGQTNFTGLNEGTGFPMWAMLSKD